MQDVIRDLLAKVNISFNIGLYRPLTIVVLRDLFEYIAKQNFPHQLERKWFDSI